MKETGPNVEQRTALFKRRGRGRGEVEHAWCKDVARDAAVRAAEDGRDRPLPTLKECIAGMVPKSVSASSAPEQENKGDGMRSERVTLEVTHGNPWLINTWEWAYILRLGTGESVRVVEEELSDAWAQRLARLTAERDAAIRERDNERLLRIETETYRDFAIREKDAAIFHITELRAERDALQARVAEREAASGGGEQEPVAYFVKWADEDWAVQDQTFRTLQRAQDYINDEKSEDDNPQIVPFYRCPPQPRGWLTGEEREAVETARDHFDNDDLGDSECVFIARMMKQILARSTPPKVRLVRHLNYFDCHGDRVNAFDAADVLAALAAAGVEVEEVGRE